MTSNNQVSPVIRISQENRDASARATHLEAANGKFLLTTNERKQMSTKTNFKRIALVAVAALGLGVLSSVPSQAVLSSTTVTVTNGTGSLTTSDSTTAALINIKSFGDAAMDSVTITIGSIVVPAGAAAVVGVLQPVDTAGATVKTAFVRDSLTVQSGQQMTSYGLSNTDTSLAGIAMMKGGRDTTSNPDSNTASNGYLAGTFAVYLDSQTARTAGTYTGSVVIKVYDAGVLNTSKTVVKDFTITIAADATASKVADSGKSVALLSNATTSAAITTDSTASDSTSVSAAATAGTAGAAIRVWLKNYAGNKAQESLTVTTDKGSVKVDANGSSGVTGKSFTAVYDATDYSNGYKDFIILGDGTAGKATITIKSTSVTFAAKTVTFYAASVAKIDAPTVLTTVIGTGAGSSNLLVKGYDSEGNQAGSGVTLYVYSSDTGVVSDYGTACTFNGTYGGHLCSITGVVAGSATFIARNKSTVALSTVASTASAAVKVSTNSAATVKLAFDKPTYAPGEKATISVSLLDSAGNSVPAGTFANAFATGGITSTLAFGNGSDTLTNVSVTTTTDATKARYTPALVYTVYMPVNGGTVSISAKGGASLPAAGQVTGTATATVTDNSSAALAAVTALATTVASLKTLIVTLTNLVLKIQKKVKA